MFGNNPPSWSATSTDENSNVQVPIRSPPFSMNGNGSNNSHSNNSGNGSGAPKPSISFPKQSMSFSPGVLAGNGTGVGVGVGGTMGSMGGVGASPSAFGGSGIGGGGGGVGSGSGSGVVGIGMNSNSNGFMINTNISAVSTPNGMQRNNSFQSPFTQSNSTSTSTSTSTSINTGINMNINTTPMNFQSNPILARPSPTATSTSSPFLHPQNGNGILNGSGSGSGSGLASSVGLRRRAVGGGTSRPPLPVMTRLGVSTDAPDSLKENLQIHPNIDSTSLLQSKTMNTPQSQAHKNLHAQNTTQLPTPLSSSSSPKLTTSTTFLATNYSCWVIISGFTNALEYNKIVTNFASYGTVVDQYPSSTFSNDGTSGNGVGVGIAGSSNTSGQVQVRTGSNWTCIKYQSSLQADKAICQNGSLVHVTGMNMNSVAVNTSSNITKNGNGSSSGSSGGGFNGSGSGNSSQSPSSNFTVQDDIVIINVMRVDESMAMTLGLKNYIEIGSTGYEKRIGGNRNGGSSSTPAIHNNSNINNMKQNNNNPQFASSINNEDDILLLGDDGGRNKNGRDFYHEGHARGGVCDKMLSWYFGW